LNREELFHEVARTREAISVDYKAWRIASQDRDVLDIQTGVDINAILSNAIWVVTLSDIAPDQIKEDVATDLPKCSCDPIVIGELVNELLLNACKYRYEGTKVTLSARVEKSTVHISVINEIDSKEADTVKNELVRVYEPFFRGSNRRHISGTGLGLWRVACLMDAHPRGKRKIQCKHLGDEFYIVSSIWVPISA
jgi:signal transduction histidine kinase